MLLRDADVERAIGKFLCKEVDTGARRHGRSYRHDLVVLARLFDQTLAENFCVLRCGGLRFGLGAGRDIKFDDAMILVRGSFRGCVALALLRYDVDEDWAGLCIAHVAKYWQQVVEIVTIDWSDIVKAKFFKQCAAGPEPARELLRASRLLSEELWQVLRQLLADIAQCPIGLAGDQPRQIGRHCAHRWRDRHVIVVENDDEPFVARAGIVHGFVRHPGRHCSVADNRHDVVLFALEVARHCHAERGRDRRGGVGGTEGIVIAFGALGETGQSAALPQGPDAVSPACKDLVRVTLMADVPDYAVAGCVEHVVKRDGQFDDAKSCTEMASGLGNGINGFGPQLVGYLFELIDR